MGGTEGVYLLYNGGSKVILMSFTSSRPLHIILRIRNQASTANPNTSAHSNGVYFPALDCDEPFISSGTPRTGKIAQATVFRLKYRYPFSSSRHFAIKIDGERKFDSKNASFSSPQYLNSTR